MKLRLNINNDKLNCMEEIESSVIFVSGDMIEGGKITVKINDNQIKRVVRYNRMDGLYFMYKNRKYFESDCDYSEYYKIKYKGNDV